MSLDLISDDSLVRHLNNSRFCLLSHGIVLFCDYSLIHKCAD